MRGLLLVVVNKNNASWQLRYERHGRERWLGLGPVGIVGLAEARERARAARLQLLDGLDPIDMKRAAKAAAALAAAKAMSFQEAATQYFNQHAAKWRNRKHRDQFLSTLGAYVFPVIGTLPVGAIDTGLVLKCLEPHWHDQTETMSRVRGRIELVLDWATVRDLRSGDNPARWRGHLAEVLPQRSKLERATHHPALPYAELPAFLAELRHREGVAARALEFVILTATRTNEVLGARWDEIDLSNATWTVPAGRMKGSREHRVPLSAPAVALLKAAYVQDGNPFVFISPQTGGGLNGTSLFAVLRRMGRRDITVHGFRSSFRDWAAEQTAYPNHVVEQALAHTVGNAVERAYRRGDLFDKRRTLMAAWASFLEKPVEAGEVIPLRATT